jgi:hypothetical protein
LLIGEPENFRKSVDYLAEGRSRRNATTNALGRGWELQFNKLIRCAFL